MKQPQWSGGQRADLLNFLYSVREFPKELQRNTIRSAIGAGLLDGFRVRVVAQTGSNVGSIDILNGRGYDHQGQFVNAITGTNSQRVNLGAASTEFWLEIEVFGFASDADQQAFWDSTVDNTDPIPDGQEIPVARTFTRQTLFWRVVRPIRQNAALDRMNPIYAPARFSDSDTLRFPVATIRTNASGQILAGNPSTDPFGNDLISVTTDLGVEQYLQIPGTGEAQNFTPGQESFILGSRRSDARMKIFEALPFPFLYGAPGENASGTTSAEWMRDLKSMFDGLATSIAQMKFGAQAINGLSSLGQYQDGELVSVDSAYNYIDVKLYNNPVASPPTYPSYNSDEILNTVIQVLAGHWAGFYAFVHGNDSTTGGDVTRLYIRRLSSVPEWKSLPVAGDAVRVIQHRQVDWTQAPSPSTSNRGYDALDTEVFEARADLNNARTFPALRTRLDSQRYPITTISPVDTVNPLTGNPSTSPPADWFQSIAEMQAAMAQVATTRGGGSVHFRKGTYTFDSLIPGDTVFSLNGVGGLEISGEGSESTLLHFGTSDDTQGIHRIFDLVNCVDVTFRDLAFAGKGEIFKMSGCRNIRFINCTFDGLFWVDAVSGAGVTTPTIDFGAITDLYMENCSITVAGNGFAASTMTRCRMNDCKILTRDIQAENTFMMLVGAVKQSEFKGLHFQGTVTLGAFECASFLESNFHDTKMFVNVGGSSRGLWVASSTATRSSVYRNFFNANALIAGVTANSFGIAVRQATDFNVTGNTFEHSAENAIVLNGWPFSLSASGTAIRCHVTGNLINFPSSAATKIGIDVTDSLDCTVSDNRINKGGTGIVYRGANHLKMANNTTDGTSFCFSTTNLNNTSALRFEHCSITGNLGIDIGESGMNLRDGDTSHVSGNHTHSTGATPTVQYDATGSTWLRGGHGVIASSHPWPGDGANNNEIYAYNTSEGGT